jgi:oligosaccharide repeat unit polymerase
MIWIFATIFGMLAVWHFRSAGSALFPPVLFAIIWASVLLGIALSGDTFYPLSIETLGLLLLGLLSFGLGGHLGLLSTDSQRVSPRHEYTYRLPVSHVLNGGGAFLLAVLPFYWSRVQGIVARADPDDFWGSLRGEASESGGITLGYFAYIGAFASFLAMVAVYDVYATKERAGVWQRLRVLLLVALALSFHLGSGGRLESLLLFFAITGLVWLRSNRIRLGPAILGGIMAGVIFAVVGYLLGKGASKDVPFTENVGTMAHEIRFYVLSGTVGFDRVVRGFLTLAPEPRTLRFFVAMAKAFGAKVDVPDIVMPFVDTPQTTNVYTMYLTYYTDFGWMGVAIIPFLLGLVAGIVYQGFRRGIPHCYILYAYFIGSLVLGIAGDMFVAALSHWVQIGVYTFVLFRRNRGPLEAPKKTYVFEPLSSGGTGRFVPARFERDSLP